MSMHERPKTDRYTLVEPCAGSAALTLHLLGARRALLPYQGSKWRFRHALSECTEQLGFPGAPHRVILTDSGPWGRVLGVVLSHSKRKALITALEQLATEDPRDVFERLNGGACPRRRVEFAAQFLFLQRLAFSGKAVGIKAGRWASPGFNASSAYGLAATARFGKVNPMVPSLIRVLRGYDTQLADVEVRTWQRGALRPLPGLSCTSTLVYIDPPYEGSTAYPNGSVSRDQVVTLARAWQAAGAAVIVSEGAPIGDGLVGWRAQRLYRGREDTSPFRGKQAEWITFAAGRSSG